MSDAARRVWHLLPDGCRGTFIPGSRGDAAAGCRAPKACDVVNSADPMPLHAPVDFLRRSDFQAAGVTDRELRAAVAAGTLLRPRAGMYLAPDAHRDVVDACRAGGRLACLSEVARQGIF